MNSIEIQKNNELIHFGKTSEKYLLNYINGIPALLWRIDIIKNKIEYLNNYYIDCLGTQSGLLIKNIEFGRQIIMDEDFYLYESFIKSVKKGKSAITIFRIKQEDNSICWIKLIGTPYKDNIKYYIGSMEDVTKTIGIVKSIYDKDTELQAMIQNVNNPVLLVDLNEKSIVALNSACEDLFEYKPYEFRKLNFSNLCHNSISEYLNRIYEEVLFNKKWEGKLFFLRKNNSEFSAEVVIRRLIIKNNQILRISIQKVDISGDSNKNLVECCDFNDKKSERQIFVKNLTNKINKLSDMKEILTTFLNNQYGQNIYDSIIFSDIYIKKGKVVVYSAGEPFDAMKMGEIFSYEGTIAENIERYKLNYLIVDDTFASIKPIDWALFIPHGVRSYFAKPFYERKILRAIIILCSTKTTNFFDKDIDNYALLYKPFLKGLKNWRKAQRLKN